MFSERMMSYAIELSKKADFKKICPNPFVGAVVCDENNQSIGEGFHAQIGGPHAEVHAIRQAMNNRADLTTCTLFVTLEPCSHHGKTPPCTELILASGLKKVVIGSYDPNPLVSGKKYLEENGVDVTEILLPEAQELNKVFFTNHTKNRPFVLLKSATTLDGKIADRYGDSKWISNSQSREIVHQRMRKNTNAILTTAGTIIQDNAKMNIRINEDDDQELNVVCIDRSLELLQHEHLSIFYQRMSTKIYLIADKKLENEELLNSRIQILHVPFDNNGLIDLNVLGEVLLKNNLFHLLVEAGSKLATTLLKNKWIDEFAIFIAPKILPDINAMTLFKSIDAMSISDAPQLQLKDIERVNDDVLLTYTLL